AFTVGFQGLRLDATSGMYNARFRDLSPTLGHWDEPDLLGFGAGDPNFYRFENDSPTELIDPSGLAWEWAWHWHPMMPQSSFKPEFLNAHGLRLDINSPEWGHMLRGKDHIGKEGIHPAGWNKVWDEWIKANKGRKITEEMIKAQLQTMKTSSRFSRFFAEEVGKCAQVGYRAWRQAKIARLVAKRLAKVARLVERRGLGALKWGGRKVSKFIPLL